MEAGAIRPGYELWRPNREKPEAQTTRVLVVFLLLVTAGLAMVITLGGWSRLEGGKIFALLYIALYVLFAFLVARWNRGVLPVASAVAMVAFNQDWHVEEERPIGDEIPPGDRPDEGEQEDDQEDEPAARRSSRRARGVQQHRTRHPGAPT